MIVYFIGSGIISFLFMVVLMYLGVRTAKHDHWVLPAILCSSAICALSLLFSVGVLLI